MNNNCHKKNAYKTNKKDYLKNRIVFFLLGGLKMTKKKMSLIDRCKQIDIVDFARNNGMAVVNKGRDYRLEDHDSFVFDRRKQRFYWNSQNINGDIIELAKLFFIEKEIQDPKQQFKSETQFREMLMKKQEEMESEEE